MSLQQLPGPWFVYLLRCHDDSLYAGITTDLGRRVQEHNGAKAGARYTRARRPVTLVYFESAPDRAEAARREYTLRRLPAMRKRQLARLERERCRDQAAQLAISEHFRALP